MRLNNYEGFTIVELLIAVTILGFLVAATINSVNFQKNATQQTTSKLLSDFSAIELAFTNYNADKNAYPTSLTDATFVNGIYLFVPQPPDSFTAYSMSSNANGYYICTSVSVTGTGDYKYQSVNSVITKTPSGKAYKNTACPSTTNADPSSYPATLYLTYWIFRN